MPHNGKNYSARQGGPAKEMATASARQTPGAARPAALVRRRPMQRWPAGQKFFRRKESGEASEKPCANARRRAAAGNVSEKRKGGQEYMQRSGGGTDGRQRERLQRRDSRLDGGEQADDNAPRSGRLQPLRHTGQMYFVITEREMKKRTNSERPCAVRPTRPKAGGVLGLLSSRRCERARQTHEGANHSGNCRARA